MQEEGEERSFGRRELPREPRSAEREWKGKSEGETVEEDEEEEDRMGDKAGRRRGGDMVG